MVTNNTPLPHSCDRLSNGEFSATQTHTSVWRSSNNILYNTVAGPIHYGNTGHFHYRAVAFCSCETFSMALKTLPKTNGWAELLSCCFPHNRPAFCALYLLLLLSQLKNVTSEADVAKMAIGKEKEANFDLWSVLFDSIFHCTVIISKVSYNNLSERVTDIKRKLLVIMMKNNCMLPFRSS